MATENVEAGRALLRNHLIMQIACRVSEVLQAYRVLAGGVRRPLRFRAMAAGSMLGGQALGISADEGAKFHLIEVHLDESRDTGAAVCALLDRQLGEQDLTAGPGCWARDSDREPVDLPVEIQVHTFDPAGKPESAPADPLLVTQRWAF